MISYTPTVEIWILHVDPVHNFPLDSVINVELLTLYKFLHVAKHVKLRGNQVYGL